MTGSNKELLQEWALEFFLKFTLINSQSDPNSKTNPSTKCQLDLGKAIVEDFHKMGLKNSVLDDFGYVYAVLPASDGSVNEPISFIAHMDTSPAEPGKNVKPTIHSNYQGGEIRFEDDTELSLSQLDSPELLKFVGEDIITSSGKTLLGADDKAGIASIMSAIKLLIQDKNILHPELRICFTPDEEIGRGVDNIDISKLAKIAYTIDGGELGELEDECFDAWSTIITLIGRNVHPGSAKNIMINAAAIASRFAADIPEWQTPEHTEKREGFFHLTEIKGDENLAIMNFIIRDFDVSVNHNRISFLKNLAETYKLKYPGLSITIDCKHSYQNMLHILKQHQDVIDKAAEAMNKVGVKTLHNAIRGGTDGARLCYLGIPTPNIFSGGLMFHSRREWLPVIALQKAAEVVIKLAELYY